MNYSWSNLFITEEEFCLWLLVPTDASVGDWWPVARHGVMCSGMGLTRQPWHGAGKWTITLSWNQNKVSLNLEHVLHKHVKRDLGSITHAWKGNALSSSERSNQPESSTNFYYKYYLTPSFLANSIRSKTKRPLSLGLHKQSRCAICLVNT